MLADEIADVANNLQIDEFRSAVFLWTRGAFTGREQVRQ